MSRTPGMEAPALYRTETAYDHFNNTFDESAFKTAVSVGNCFKVHPEYMNFRRLQFIRSAYLCTDWSQMAAPLLKELKRIETS